MVLMVRLHPALVVPLPKLPQRRTIATAAARHGNVAMEDVATPHKPVEDVLVQYIVIRRDLIDNLKWPLGSVISQGCHAAVAATWIHKEDQDTIRYCSPENIDSMHKVTLEVKGETQLLNLSNKLKDCAVEHKLWIEQPEGFPTCLATKPYFKSSVSQHFKKLKLCK